MAEHCLLTGSPLYHRLLRGAAADIEAGGPCWAVVRGHERPWGSAPLRLMGAVHRLVLCGRAPALAPYYPSVTGVATTPPDVPDGVWPAFRDEVRASTTVLRELVSHPVQTNEVGRCAVLASGFLLVARETALPLRLLELGASAGLNLRWDHYRYGSGAAVFGDPESPVHLDEPALRDRPLIGAEAVVTERSGCDLAPVDATSPEGVLTLKSYLWADQVERFGRLEGALQVAGRVPVRLERDSAPRWLAKELRRPAPGVATVVYHSYLQQYLGPADAARLKLALAGAARRATPQAPLAWLRFEPAGVRGKLRLSLWPRGLELAIASATDVGREIHWLLDRAGAPLA